MFQVSAEQAVKFHTEGPAGCDENDTEVPRTDSFSVLAAVRPLSV